MRILYLCLLPLVIWAEPLITVPQMLDQAPAAGARVKVTPPEYTGTEIYHSLYLPECYEPGGRYPVLVEYTGNLHLGSGSTGEVKDANLGYAVAERLGAIWLVMPYVQGEESILNWWGSEGETLEYALMNIRRVCENYGGNPAEVFICGFSRGAIGVNYLGLHNEEIADTWLGFFSHDHYDGQKSWTKTGGWGGPLEKYRAEARTRMERMADRAALISSGGKEARYRSYIGEGGLDSLGVISYVSPNVREIIPGFPNKDVPHPHTDKWMLYPSDEAEVVFQWFADTIENKPGTYSISGAVHDADGKPLAGVVVNAGRTHFAVTDPAGHYRIEGLVAGARQVEAQGKVHEVSLKSDLEALDFVLEL
ncbi:MULTISPECIES: carboxypeptidase regulatory-like domain-containing protein [unclassified Lentimonas]|uniref:carboxypeptidase regulatory-like domain-containing protein n=1 Tax=unclassified Lentimonas TaxID=2630993 RepID=UPI00132A455A|nr:MULTISPECIES: carboxypeptidase regulatory-like domain-containing protein [unclassified Lentimonas]CAA6692409.1 Unannotated [Lentimonas sp. CC19]CAA6693995.1 Unannotated [Lentimonas sp. CC10]CAA7072227.1 Unannotated [Lentimonas sp. CC11]